MMRFRINFVVVVLFCLVLAPAARGEERLTGLHPYISISEEYNDNLFLAPVNKKDDFITTVQPGVKFSNMDKTGGIDLDYNLGLVFYSKDSDMNYISHNAQLTAKYLTKEHLSFSVRESFIRSDEPREAEYFTTAADNSYVLATESQRYIYWRNVIAPTFEYQFGPDNRIGVNYRNNIYHTQDPFSENSQENYLSPFLDYWFDRRNGISLEYGYTRGDFEKSSDLDSHMAKARYTYKFSSKTSAFTEYTYTNWAYDDSSRDYDLHKPEIGMTFLLTSRLTASAQAGYFWQVPKDGDSRGGISYKGELAQVDPRTSYRLNVEGGHKEDVFTAENLGFARYHRLSLVATHMLDRRFSVGLKGGVEKADYDKPAHNDTTWAVGGNVSYLPLRWLVVSLEVLHTDRDSNVDTYDYTENRAMFRITAMY